MMKKVLFSIVALLMVSVGVVFGQDTRINNLTQNSIYTSGGFLLQDEYLVQYYPSSIFKYGTHAMVQQPNVQNNEYGVFGYASAMYVKDSFAIGGYFNRQTVDVGGIELRPIELLMAYNLGKMQIGAILSVDQLSVKDTVTVNPNEFDLFVFGFQPSLSFTLSESSGMDVSAPIILGSGTSKTGAVTNSELSATGIGVGGRFYSDKLIIPFNIGNVGLLTEIPAVPQKNNLTESYFHVGAGRTHQLSEHNFLIYGANFNRRGTKDETTIVNTSNTLESSISNISVLLGGEFSFWKDRLKARGSYGYNIFNQQRDQQVISALGVPGALSLGVGFDSKHFRFDASLSTDLVSNGFFFVTGNNSQFFPRFTLIGRL
jgi:hypothetical protein